MAAGSNKWRRRVCDAADLGLRNDSNHQTNNPRASCDAVPASAGIFRVVMPGRVSLGFVGEIFRGVEFVREMSGWNFREFPEGEYPGKCPGSFPGRICPGMSKPG